MTPAINQAFIDARHPVETLPKVVVDSSFNADMFDVETLQFPEGSSVVQLEGSNGQIGIALQIIGRANAPQRESGSCTEVVANRSGKIALFGRSNNSLWKISSSIHGVFNSIYDQERLKETRKVGNFQPFQGSQPPQNDWPIVGRNDLWLKGILEGTDPFFQLTGPITVVAAPALDSPPLEEEYGPITAEPPASSPPPSALRRALAPVVWIWSLFASLFSALSRCLPRLRH